jgi:Uri superfamily endonuclease
MVLTVSTAPPCLRLGGDREDFCVYHRAMPFVATAAEAPTAPGAYALLVALDAALLVHAGRRSAVLERGRYLYCGSAKGPGGLRARLGRHFCRGKAQRWHIDQLTEAGRVLGAFVAPGGDECALVAAHAHLPVPLEGFGSSDCPRCRSHLLRWPAEARGAG